MVIFSTLYRGMDPIDSFDSTVFFISTIGCFSTMTDGSLKLGLSKNAYLAPSGCK